MARGGRETRQDTGSGNPMRPGRRSAPAAHGVPQRNLPPNQVQGSVEESESTQLITVRKRSRKRSLVTGNKQGTY